MREWFRFSDSALDDPRIQRLSPELFRAWVNMLCLASKNDGVLPAIAEIAFRLRMSEQNAATAIEDLITAELIGIGLDGVLRPRNWDGRPTHHAARHASWRADRHPPGRPATFGDAKAAQACKSRGGG